MQMIPIVAPITIAPTRSTNLKSTDWSLLFDIDAEILVRTEMNMIKINNTFVPSRSLTYFFTSFVCSYVFVSIVSIMSSFSIILTPASFLLLLYVFIATFQIKYIPVEFFRILNIKAHHVVTDFRLDHWLHWHLRHHRSRHLTPHH